MFLLIFRFMKITLSIFSVLLMFMAGCTSSRLAVEDQPVTEKEFLYMEEIYAYAKNSFSAGKFDEAVEWYDRLDSDYPGNPYKAESLFIRGYVSKDYRDDIMAAEKYFRELINKYPDSEFANSASFELEHLNDPDFMPEFEK